jgi:hypothetical protein
MIRAAHIPGFRRGRIGQAAAGSAMLASSALSAGIGAATSLAAAAIGDWMNSIQLSHDADTATTLIVNGLASQLSNLNSAYFADPASCASQRAALDAYDQAWAWLQSPQACGNPSYGSAGNRCISDRAPGGKYPWQTYYRDPIANDPRLAGAGCDTGIQVLLPSVTTGAYTATNLTSSGGSAVSGQTAAQLATNAVASATLPAAAGSILSGIPDLYVLAGVGLIALFFLMPSKGHA